jgi:hypothetical protein
VSGRTTRVNPSEGADGSGAVGGGVIGFPSDGPQLTKQIATAAHAMINSRCNHALCRTPRSDFILVEFLADSVSVQLRHRP